MQLNISIIGSTKVGQNLNITCTVRVVERLVVTPTIEIIKMNTTDIYLLQDINVLYTVTTDDTGSETNWTIILEPVKFEDRGVYICKADFNVTGVNGTNDPATATYDFQFVEEDYELIVDCKLHNNDHTIILLYKVDTFLHFYICYSHRVGLIIHCIHTIYVVFL